MATETSNTAIEVGMVITEEINLRFEMALSEIPKVVADRIRFLNEHRVGSVFDKHGAVQHVIGLGESHIKKVAVGLLRATYANPYLTDQEKLQCLREDSPDVYVMEACIDLAEAFEYRLEQINEKRVQIKALQNIKRDVKKLERKQSFEIFLKSVLEWVTPASVYNAVMLAKQENAVARNPMISSFLDRLTVNMLKQQIEEILKYEESKGNLNLRRRSPEQILNSVIDGQIKLCQSAIVRSRGIGSLVRRKPKYASYRPSQGS